MLRHRLVGFPKRRIEHLGCIRLLTTLAKLECRKTQIRVLSCMDRYRSQM